MAKKASERTDADRRVRQCERLARLMQTLHLISGKGRWDASSLAAELECSRRTVHRLLQTLSMAGVPWFFDEKLKAYQIRPGFKFPLVEQPTGSSSENRATDDLTLAADRLIKECETLTESLQQFINSLRSIREHLPLSKTDPSR